MQIKEIAEDTPGYDEDETEFVTLNGVPFTGIVRGFHNGNLSSLVSYHNGLQCGYYVWYYTVGPSVGAVQVVAERDGIYVSYDEAGIIRDIRKDCSGRVLERMRIVGETYQVDEVMDIVQKDALFSNPAYFTKYCRREPIQKLYEEVVELFGKGSLFDDGWLYTEDGYYDDVGARLS